MSTRIQIDFAKPAWYAPSYLTSLGVSLILLGILLLTGVYAYTFMQDRHEAELNQQEVAIDLPSPVIEKPSIEAPILNRDQVQILTDMINQLNVPWNHLFNALDALKDPNVALISIIPNYQRQQLELIGEARNIPAMLAYIESLEALPMLEHVTLQKHQVNEAHPYQPVEFIILARWPQ